MSKWIKAHEDALPSEGYYILKHEIGGGKVTFEALRMRDDGQFVLGAFAFAHHMEVEDLKWKDLIYDALATIYYCKVSREDLEEFFRALHYQCFGYFALDTSRGESCWSE
jgi:hypothetical protein